MTLSRRSQAAPELVGVLGGTFDPVHLGHLHVARWVRRVFGVARVVLVPCAVPPHKERAGLAPASDRLSMLRLAARDEAGIEVCSLEVDRGGVSYTLPTLLALREGPPPTRPLLIVGMDALAEIGTWYRHRVLLSEFDLVAVDRPGGRTIADAGFGGPVVPVPCVEGGALGIAAEEPGRGGRVFHLAIPPVPVSSSEIRALASRGASLAGLVPPDVARYIQDRDLYRQEEAP